MTYGGGTWGGAAIESIEFKSHKACMDAAQDVLKRSEGEYYKIKTMCVEKGK